MTPNRRPGYLRDVPRPVYRVHDGRSGPTPLALLGWLGWVELAAILCLAVLASELFLS